MVLLVLVLALVGFACACITSHPAKAIERGVSALAALPALVEVWSLFAAGIFGAALLVVRGRIARERASPAVLQRFLL